MTLRQAHLQERIRQAAEAMVYRRAHTPTKLARELGCSRRQARRYCEHPDFAPYARELAKHRAEQVIHARAHELAARVRKFKQEKAAKNLRRGYVPLDLQGNVKEEVQKVTPPRGPEKNGRTMRSLPREPTRFLPLPRRRDAIAVPLRTALQELRGRGRYYAEILGGVIEGKSYREIARDVGRTARQLRNVRKEPDFRAAAELVREKLLGAGVPAKKLSYRLARLCGPMRAPSANLANGPVQKNCREIEAERSPQQRQPAVSVALTPPSAPTQPPSVFQHPGQQQIQERSVRLGSGLSAWYVDLHEPGT